MNGIKPKFMECDIVSENYYEMQDPYVDAPSCHVDLLELLRYAKKCGKKLTELSKEEVQKFAI